jgi:hypothetical protein
MSGVPVTPRVGQRVRLSDRGRSTWDQSWREVNITSVNPAKQTFCAHGIGWTNSPHKPFSIRSVPYADIETVVGTATSKRRGVGDTFGAKPKRRRRNIFGRGRGLPSNDSVDEVEVEVEAGYELGSCLDEDLSAVLAKIKQSEKLPAAISWCEEQGADELAEVVQADGFLDLFLDALALKPIKRSLLRKAILEKVGSP